MTAASFPCRRISFRGAPRPGRISFSPKVQSRGVEIAAPIMIGWAAYHRVENPSPRKMRGTGLAIGDIQS